MFQDVYFPKKNIQNANVAVSYFYLNFVGRSADKRQNFIIMDAFQKTLESK